MSPNAGLVRSFPQTSIKAPRKAGPGPGCLGAALRANSLVCGRVWAREAGALAAMIGGDSAADRSRRPFGPDEFRRQQRC
jgi:hypothetical protein